MVVDDHHQGGRQAGDQREREDERRARPQAEHGGDCSKREDGGAGRKEERGEPDVSDRALEHAGHDQEG
jgi:hypothetical protein